MVNLKKTSPAIKKTSPVKKAGPEELVESKKARRNRMRAEAKKYEELKRKEKARESSGLSSSDDDDRVMRNTNLLKTNKQLGK